MDLLLTACGDAKIDGSSLGKFAESTKEMRESIPPEEVGQFRKDVILISFWGQTVAEVINRDGSIDPHMAGRLNGLSAKDIKKAAAKIRARAESGEITIGWIMF